MPRIAELAFLSLVMVLPMPEFQNPRRVRSARSRVPKILSFESSSSIVQLCPFVPSGACSPTGTRVTLEVKAGDPENDHLTYRYSVSKGAIEGSGPIVLWDLKGTFGTQTATVEVTDPLGGKASGVLRVDAVSCGACDPPCPTVNVTCPTNVPEGEIAIFDTRIWGGELTQKLTYLWSHSNGERVAGQEGSKLRIRARGLPGDVITATVRILGFDPACGHQASCETRISKRP